MLLFSTLDEVEAAKLSRRCRAVGVVIADKKFRRLTTGDDIFDKEGVLIALSIIRTCRVVGELWAGR